MPLINSPRERNRGNWIVGATWHGHVIVSLPKSDYAAVTRSTQKQKVWAIWPIIVIGLYSFIFLNLVAVHDCIPSIRITLLQSLRALTEHFPDLD